MPASAPVRAAIVFAALAALTAGYFWWNNPERHIRRLLSDVESALSHDGAETDLLALAAVAALQVHLTPDVVIETGGSSPPVRGRQDVISLAARVRASSPLMRVQFFDPKIQLSDDSNATTRVTMQVTTRDAGGEELAAAHDVSIALVLVEGRWQVASARVLPDQDARL